MSTQFADRMRAMRQEAGLTLKQVGDALGFSVPYVSDLERGRRNPPGTDKLTLFCDICGKPEEVAELERLILADGGHIELRAPTRELQEVVVALHRRSATLDPDQVRRIRSIIEGWE